MTDAPNLALFCDFENIAIGAKEANFDDFDIELVLERLLEKGRVLAKKAYCDWERYQKYRKAMHNAAFELIEVPHVSYSGKNSADMHMCVDALDLCYTRDHIDTFVILSGDSDFSPLVRKLRENNKYVIGFGVKKATSDLLVENCDEFIYYDDLVRKREGRKRGRRRPPDTKGRGKSDGKPEERSKRDEAVELVAQTAETLLQERDGPLWGSIVKQTIRRKRPNFDESYYGFRTFSQVLEEARDQGLLELQLDEKSGGYIIVGLGPDA